MGNLYLVRHGQASFGAADYDQLSELGRRQSVRLGEYFANKGLTFDAVLIGTLRRHAQTWAGIAQGAGISVQPLQWPGLNEYDSEAVIATIHPHKLEKPDSPGDVSPTFPSAARRFDPVDERRGQPQGMPTYPDFLAGVTSALDHVRKNHDGNVLIVSSGGPISTAVGHILGTTPETTIELNLRIRNSSVTEFAFTPKRHMLVTYNTLPHLDHADYADWVTYA
ncbi:MAG: histidine phosphatase family protein [Rhodoferax sp.]|nr:histidine phosphatase family protein [Rhodoferax sp.]